MNTTSAGWLSAVLWGIWLASGAHPTAGSSPLVDALDAQAKVVEPRVIEWRRDLHQHPELGNREFRTAALVAAHLSRLGFEVRTNVAHTGVVGVFQGGRPGGTVALRADMDALPVTEQTGLPFASKARAQWQGQEVGVMHACGHDAHVAILMGVAEVLAGLRAEWPGTVKLLFQPAEEGSPPGEEGGADLMIREGALEDPAPEAIFGLHVFPGPVGHVGWREGASMASSDHFLIAIRGRQTHGALPWKGIDPIVVGAQIVLGLQTIVSRQTDLTLSPAVVTVGRFQGGVRSNIIPDEALLEGTIRALNEDVRRRLHERVEQTAEGIAEASAAEAIVTINDGTPVVMNDPRLARQMRPTLERVVGAERVYEARAQTTAEDFAYYQEQIPGLYLRLAAGGSATDGTEGAPNHSPFFDIDERALLVGVRVLSHLALDYLAAAPGSR